MADLEVVVLSGSLRKASTNTMVADALAEHSPAGVAVVRFDISAVPLFDQDVEDAGDPHEVIGLKAAVSQADGLVMVTPEYNYGVPAVAKNAVDWLSRPYGSGPIKGTAVGVASAGPGSRGGAGARAHLADTFGVLTEHFYEETLGLPKVHSLLDDDGLGRDGLDLLLPWFDAFCEFARAAAEGQPPAA